MCKFENDGNENRKSIFRLVVRIENCVGFFQFVLPYRPSNTYNGFTLVPEFNWFEELFFSHSPCI